MCLHAAKLEAVSVSLVMGSQVVVVKHPNAKHCGVDAGAQEEDGDKARHLVGRIKKTTTNRLSRGMNIIGIERALKTKWRCSLFKKGVWFLLSDLNVQVVIVSFSQLDEDCKQWQDGPGAEESALGPDHGYAEQSQDHGQQPVEPALQ